jgi:hypothetical protein
LMMNMFRGVLMDAFRITAHTRQENYKYLKLYYRTLEMRI